MSLNQWPRVRGCGCDKTCVNICVVQVLPECHTGAHDECVDDAVARLTTSSSPDFDVRSTGLQGCNSRSSRPDWEDIVKQQQVRTDA
jgi:hypothetical protein